MQYILLQLDSGSTVYQCIRNGYVMANRDMEGNLVDIVGGSFVIDANPPTPAWDAPDEPEAVVLPEVVPKLLTRVEFLKRLTSEERIAIRQTAKVSPQLEDFMAMLDAADGVDLADPLTAGGIHMLEQIGLLGVGRAFEILG